MIGLNTDELIPIIRGESNLLMLRDVILPKNRSNKRSLDPWIVSPYEIATLITNSIIPRDNSRNGICDCLKIWLSTYTKGGNIIYDRHFAKMSTSEMTAICYTPGSMHKFLKEVDHDLTIASPKIVMSIYPWDLPTFSYPDGDEDLVLYIPSRYIKVTKEQLEKMQLSKCLPAIRREMKCIFLAATPNHCVRALSLLTEQPLETQMK